VIVVNHISLTKDPDKEFDELINLIDTHIDRKLLILPDNRVPLIDLTINDAEYILQYNTESKTPVSSIKIMVDAWKELS
jgi:hypothetical protein